MDYIYDEATEFVVDNKYNGIRIDKLLSSEIDCLSRSGVEKLFDLSLISVNGKPVNKNYKVKHSDEISLIIPTPKELKIAAQDIPLDVVYEDDCLLVVNKPKGMVVHPAAGNFDNTLVNGLLYHCEGSLSGINGIMRPGIVHRIDKDTAGLLLVAKNDIAHLSLSEQIKAHTVDRIYFAVIHGKLKNSSGIIDAPIGRSAADRKKMCVTQKNSKSAVTHYEVIEELKGYSVIKCILETGRTHQIRVHMSYLGHPLVGDEVYGYKGLDLNMKGQCLFASQIGFNHPVTGERMLFKADIPQWFTDFINKYKYN